MVASKKPCRCPVPRRSHRGGVGPYEGMVRYAEELGREGYSSAEINRIIEDAQYGSLPGEDTDDDPSPQEQRKADYLGSIETGAEAHEEMRLLTNYRNPLERLAILAIIANATYGADLSMADLMRVIASDRTFMPPIGVEMRPDIKPEWFWQDFWKNDSDALLGITILLGVEAKRRNIKPSELGQIINRTYLRRAAFVADVRARLRTIGDAYGVVTQIVKNLVGPGSTGMRRGAPRPPARRPNCGCRR